VYNYFIAASGAILPDPQEFLETICFSRVACWQRTQPPWPFAAVPLNFFSGFPVRYSQAAATSEKVITAFSRLRFEVTREYLFPARPIEVARTMGARYFRSGS
jgi:hypothetical protein